MPLKLGICGTEGFARHFVPLFMAHPMVDEVVIADLRSERVSQYASDFGIEQTFSSLDELCAANVDAIALFTQRQLHGPQVVQALRAGKHVYSAVPIAQTLEEITEIVNAVNEEHLIYMTG